MTSKAEKAKSRSVKEAALQIWNNIGSVEITSASDIKSGGPVVPVLGNDIRQIMMETILGCAARIDDYEDRIMLEELAADVGKKRLHQLYTDLSEEANDDSKAGA
jgi:hypothetical protein